MPSFFTTGLLASLAGSAAAHMLMDFPAPFRAKNNPFATNIDYSMTAPLNADGSNYPCKGYHSDLGTDAGRPTATFAQGGKYNISISGGAPHNGGSCQISLSYDKGQTFTVIESIIGGCPLQSNYDFTIPPDAQPGVALLSWSWHNQVGNREMYQNCAAVTIAGGSAKKRAAYKNNKRAVAYSARPQIFVANIGNGCTVAEGAPVQYPSPGPDVEGTQAGAAPPTGNCGPSAPGGGGGGDNGGDGAPAPEPTTAPAAPPAPEPTTAAPAPPAATTPGGVFFTITTDNSVPTSAPVADVPSESAAPVAPLPTTEQAPPAAPVPTTLQTVTQPATSAAAPITTGTPDSGSGSGSGDGTAFPQGASCSPEGLWNCVNGGTAFQRCASGVWSAVLQMAPGTKCTPGEETNLRYGAGRKKLLRVARARKF